MFLPCDVRFFQYEVNPQTVSWESIKALRRGDGWRVYTPNQVVNRLLVVITVTTRWKTKGMVMDIWGSGVEETRVWHSVIEPIVLQLQLWNNSQVGSEKNSKREAES